MAVYCINLKHRTDRKQHSIQEFKKLGIPKVIYLPFVKDIRGGAYGCFDSHMKIWTDFLSRFPKEKYAFVFEDDLVYSSKDKDVLKKATTYIDEHYKELDVLFLHTYCVKVEDPINTKSFTRGYGFGTHAYVITRHYIESILRDGKLPEANGRHIDFEMSFNFNKKNLLYSENMFYTNEPCFTQLIDKSDNYVNVLDKFFRFDVNQNLDAPLCILRFLKKHKLITDKKAKKFHCILYDHFIDTL
jgi:GR25 family glycosyltransferase involved in LPS biosynthesis